MLGIGHYEIKEKRKENRDALIIKAINHRMVSAFMFTCNKPNKMLIVDLFDYD